MPLKHVVSPRSEVQEGLLDHSHHEPARQDMLKYLFKNSKRLRSKSLIIRYHSSTQNLLFITWTPDLASLQRRCCSHSIGTCRTHWSSNSRRSDKSLLSWIWSNELTSCFPVILFVLPITLHYIHRNGILKTERKNRRYYRNTHSAASFSLAFCWSRCFNCSMVCPRKRGRPVSNIS